MRRCSQCFQLIQMNDKTLQWETLVTRNAWEYSIGSNCAMCSSSVSVTSLGKSCARSSQYKKNRASAVCIHEKVAKINVFLGNK